jgi:hypothetical protein
MRNCFGDCARLTFLNLDFKDAHSSMRLASGASFAAMRRVIVLRRT